MPTLQQKDLSVSCPHQDWLGVNLKNCDLYVRRSHVRPGEAHVPEVEPGEENPYPALTQALYRAYHLAREYKDRGDRVRTNIDKGVHLVTPPGEAPFYLFVEYVDRTASPRQARVVPSTHNAAPQPEYITQTVRVEKRALKVLKAVAERNDQPVNELLEEIIAASLDGESVFDPDMMRSVAQLKALYGITPLEAEARVA